MSTRITFSGDAIEPKVITFGGTPLVRWYAYLRTSLSNRLCLQRSVDGVLEPEIVVVESNPPALNKAESEGITWFDFHADPVDVTKAYLYFIADGTLWRNEIVSTPIGEAPTTTQYDRVNNRYERLNLKIGAANSAEANFRVNTGPGVYSVESFLIPGSAPGLVKIFSIVYPPFYVDYDPDILEFYRLPTGAIGEFYQTLPIPPLEAVPVPRFVILEVAAATLGSPIVWAMRAVQTKTGKKDSVFTRVTDTGETPTVELISFNVGAGTSSEPSFKKQSQQPIKLSRAEAISLAAGAGSSAEPSYKKIPYTPIKKAYSETISLRAGGVCSAEPSFRKS